MVNREALIKTLEQVGNDLDNGEFEVELGDEEIRITVDSGYAGINTGDLAKEADVVDTNKNNRYITFVYHTDE